MRDGTGRDRDNAWQAGPGPVKGPEPARKLHTDTYAVVTVIPGLLLEGRR